MKQNIELSTYFAQQVLNAAAAGCDQVHPGTHKKAKQLCGRQFWEELSRPEQIQAGHIISAFVSYGYRPPILPTPSRLRGSPVDLLIFSA